jgi:hypothetical protein
MSNLIPLDQAAQMLGMDVKVLNSLRLQNRIVGVREGTAWKFKLDELKRYATDNGISLRGEGNGGADDDDMEFELSSGSLKLDEASSDEVIKTDSDSIDLSEDLMDSAELQFGSSDISLASEDDRVIEGNTPQSESPSSTGKLLAGSGGPEDQLLTERGSLLEPDSDEMDSDFDDSDLVLDDSDSSKKVSLEANDSGINLSPTDSGISLEEQPLELGGSDIDSLELPDDDDAISLEDAGELDAPTELRAEDDFNLTPSFDAGEEESSGSQVIALEDSELFADDSAPTMLSDSDVAEQPQLIAEDSAMVEPVAGETVPTVPAIPLKTWEVAMLGLTTLVSALCAMVAFDVARHIWQGPDQAPLTATLMDFFVGQLGRGT